MGVLTSDMTRLRGEIDASHATREALTQNLARGMKDLKRGVNAMMTAFRASHLQMAKRTRADCLTFLDGVSGTVDHIRGTVASLRKEFASDLHGARRAWRGGDGARRARPAAKRGAGGRGKRT